MTYACSAPERGLSLWDWTVGALHQDRCSVGGTHVGSELSGFFIIYRPTDRTDRRGGAEGGHSHTVHYILSLKPFSVKLTPR